MPEAEADPVLTSSLASDYLWHIRVFRSTGDPKYWFYAFLLFVAVRRREFLADATATESESRPRPSYTRLRPTITHHAGLQ